MLHQVLPVAPLLVERPIPARIPMGYTPNMKNAPRFPSRWAGRMHTLGTMAVLSVALGACNTVMGAREGTMEYPGSAAGPNAVPVYVVKDKDTVDGLSRRYGVPSQTIIDRNNLKAPYTCLLYTSPSPRD